MKNLISMKDFILKIENKIKKEDYQIAAWQTKVNAIDRMFNYANFLNQPLKKGMFVPCDEKDNFLITPTEHNQLYWSNQYKTAKEKVIFDGFELTNHKNMFKKNVAIVTFFDKEKSCFFDCLINNDEKKIKTIEDLIPYKLKLTKKIKL